MGLAVAPLFPMASGGAGGEAEGDLPFSCGMCAEGGISGWGCLHLPPVVIRYVFRLESTFPSLPPVWPRCGLEGSRSF